MKTCPSLVAFSAALLCGCASGQRNLVLEPVGPSEIRAAAPATTGTLVVFSAFDVHAPNVGDFRDVQSHSDYKIYSDDGKLLQVVHNHPRRLDEEPAHVELPPGRYRVVANSNGYGVVTVPVVVKADQATTVHLEGGTWSNEANKKNAVRLPDGEVVGYRASAAENAYAAE